MRRATRAPKLLKLGIEGLPVDADAGVAETAVLRLSFRHIFREPLPFDRTGGKRVFGSLEAPMVA
jgi:hypothetical protein